MTTEIIAKIFAAVLGVAIAAYGGAEIEKAVQPAIHKICPKCRGPR